MPERPGTTGGRHQRAKRCASFDLSSKTIWIAGHTGMVGQALLLRLEGEPCRILTVDHRDLDLTHGEAVARFLTEVRPDAIIVAAARVGGILANTLYPAEFLSENLAINLNIARAAHAADIDRVLFLGSSCIYPRLAPQPITEDALLTGPLEPTNQFYALAKIATVKLAEAYSTQYGRAYTAAMPTNLYGPHDNFDLEASHVIPLLRKTHEARYTNASHMELWGTGTARREFLHVDDCADALVLVLQKYTEAAPINIGCGKDLALIDLAHLICEIVGYEGAIRLDPSRPDGAPRKRLDIARLSALGWMPSIPLREGLIRTYEWYQATTEVHWR